MRPVFPSLLTAHPPTHTPPSKLQRVVLFVGSRRENKHAKADLPWLPWRVLACRRLLASACSWKPCGNCANTDRQRESKANTSMPSSQARPGTVTVGEEISEEEGGRGAGAAGATDMARMGMIGKQETANSKQQTANSKARQAGKQRRKAGKQRM